MEGGEGGGIMIKEQSDADTDITAYGQLWVKTATPNNLMFTDDTGFDNALATTGRSIALSLVFN